MTYRDLWANAAAERAARVGYRLIVCVEVDESYDPETVAVADTGEECFVLAGRDKIFGLLEADEVDDKLAELEREAAADSEEASA